MELNRSEGSAVDYANHGGAEVRAIVRADQGGYKLELKLELTSELDVVLKVQLKLELNSELISELNLELNLELIKRELK